MDPKKLKEFRIFNFLLRKTNPILTIINTVLIRNGELGQRALLHNFREKINIIDPAKHPSCNNEITQSFEFNLSFIFTFEGQLLF